MSDPDKPIIFASNESIRKWALDLIDATGGRKYMPFGKELKKQNIDKIRVLIIQFVEEFEKIKEVLLQMEKEEEWHNNLSQ